MCEGWPLRAQGARRAVLLRRDGTTCHDDGEFSHSTFEGTVCFFDNLVRRFRRVFWRSRLEEGRLRAEVAFFRTPTTLGIGDPASVHEISLVVHSDGFGRRE